MFDEPTYLLAGGSMSDINTKNRMIEVSYNTQQITNILTEFKNYNLNPVFQRKSVWKTSDRIKFVETILEDMPCPTVFVFRRWDKHKKKTIYDVIDGKQRLETIFLFSGKLSPKQLAVDPTQKRRIKDWLSKAKFSSLTEDQKKDFHNFKIPVGQLSPKDTTDGSDQGMGDVIAAFVRINTQGKPLTKQEQTNANYIHSPLLLMAKKLSTSFHKIFEMSDDQIGRMKDVEITLELLITIQKKETLNKKTAINVALKDAGITKREIGKTSSQFKAIIGLLKKLDLGKNTRYVRKTSDFYSLFKALLVLHNSKTVFNNRKNYAKANRELATFSANVADIADAHKNKKYGYLKKHSNTPYYKYWFTTQSNTDSKEHRDIRTNILREIIGRSFNSKKDKKRLFSVIQKEQVWESSKEKKCSWPGCKKKLSWDTATVDHIIPWSQGGVTAVANAQLMCRQHNSMKKDKDFSKYFVSS
jgi:5-methylcytosine-specific restriction endonuclease McrA